MILEIDKELLRIDSEIREFAKNLNFEIFAEFELSELIEFNSFDSLNYSGVYLIEIGNSKVFSNFSDWAKDFEIKWYGEDDSFKWQFTPNPKKMRINFHSELHDWIPLYIGKSKNIKSRMNDHFFKKLKQKTFALKFLERKNLYNSTIRISTIKIKVENYNMIMPIIESELRNRINPILGRQ